MGYGVARVAKYFIMCLKVLRIIQTKVLIVATNEKLCCLPYIILI